MSTTFNNTASVPIQNSNPTSEKNIYEPNALISSKEFLYQLLVEHLELVLQEVKSRVCMIEYLMKSSRKKFSLFKNPA